MKSVIREVLNGKRWHYDTIGQTEELKEINGRFFKKYDELSDGLTDEKKKTLEELIEIQSEIIIETEESLFQEGMKLGLLLAMEANT